MGAHLVMVEVGNTDIALFFSLVLANIARAGLPCQPLLVVHRTVLPICYTHPSGILDPDRTNAPGIGLKGFKSPGSNPRTSCRRHP